MKSISLLHLCIFILIISQSVYCQDRSWSIDTCFSVNKGDIKTHEKLLSTGLRVFDGQLQIQNVEAWKYFLSRNKNFIRVGDTTIDAKSIKESLIAQYSKNQSNRPIRKFKRYLNNLNNKNILGKRISYRRYLDSTFNILPIDNDSNFEISFFTRDPLTNIYFDKLNVAIPNRLHELEDALCEPFYRHRHFDYVDDQLMKFQYQPYKPRPVENIKQSFTLFFDQNSTNYHQSDIDKIVALLSQDSLEITAAEIEGYSSVEGDPSNNENLHKKRASILLDVLQPFADKPLRMEVRSEEDWSLYRQQLHDLEQHYWDDYSNKEIKSLLNNDSTLARHEPMLKLQRRAALTLYLQKRLSEEEMIRSIKKDYSTVESLFLTHKYRTAMKRNYHSNKLDRKSLYFIGRMMAIKEYAIKMLNRGLIDYNQVAYLWEDHSSEEEELADFFIIKRLFESGQKFNNVPVGSILLRAHANFSELKNPNKVYTKDPNFVKSMQVLSLTMKLIENNMLDEQFIFKLEYPKTIAHSHLRASLEDFVIANNIRKKDEENTTPGPKPFSKEWMFTDHGYAYYGLVKNTSGVSFFKNINGEQDMTVNTRSDFYYQFDLYELLMFNIRTWDNSCDSCYDPDLDAEKLHRLMRLLFRVNKRICPDQLYQLALDFHLKYLKHQNDLVDFNDNAKYSYDFIKNYYLRNARELSDQAQEKVASLFLMFNKYRFFNESKADVEKLINKRSWTRNSNVASK